MSVPAARGRVLSGTMRAVRRTRVVYVENDPALRGILGEMLARHPLLELLLAASGPGEVLGSPFVAEADVALIDLALGAGVMNGIDLGLALRERNENLGVVIHSQHEAARVHSRLPADDLMGWSFVPKTGDMRMDDLVEVLRSTALGMSSGMEGRGAGEGGAGAAGLAELSDRQRAAMALAAEGLNAPEIARRLGRSSDAVRQDLSRAYRVLVPEMVEGDDRRTRAVVVYLRLMRKESWDES